MFHIGQEVVCVDADPPPKSSITGGMPWLISLAKGSIYTVTGIGLTNTWDPRKLPCITVAEAPNHVFWAHRFRPLSKKKTDISVFTAMLRKDKDKVRA